MDIEEEYQRDIEEARTNKDPKFIKDLLAWVEFYFPERLQFVKEIIEK